VENLNLTALANTGMANVAMADLSIQTIFSQPFFIGLFASSLCGLGLNFLASEAASGKGRKRIDSFRLLAFFKSNRNFFNCAMNSIAVSILVLAWTKSIVITLPFSFFAAVITWAYGRNKGRREAAAMLQVWPEVTDHLISAIHSGLSLSEALVGLGNRGPEKIRPYFITFHQELLASGDFVDSTQKLKARLDSPGSDQILEALLLAKSLGGTELLQIFRTLGDFLRQDLALRKEIEIKHGWIKNSAHLSSAAPWLLLLLLSSQPGTVASFAQPGGVVILLTGLLLTSVAYLWMGRLGQLPNPPRVFE
jgi:tight adherence protein B